MRKTLAVLILMIGSLLFLAGPAWAHHLYRISKVNATTTIDADSFSTRYEVLTNCPRYVPGSSPRKASKLTITSSSFNPQTVSATWVGTKKIGTTTWQRWRFTGIATTSGGATTLQNVSGKCNGATMTKSSNLLVNILAFSGRSVVHQLLLGFGLLMVGGLLVAVSLHPRQARIGRWGAGP